MNEDNKKKSGKKVYSRWKTKYKIKKLSKFKISNDDKVLMRAKDTDLKKMVIEDLNKNLKKYKKEIEETNNKLKKLKNEEALSLKKHKKYVLNKIRKIKKCLNDEGGINARVKLLKLKKRKLLITNKKITKSLENLKYTLSRDFKRQKRQNKEEKEKNKKEEKNKTNKEEKE